MPSYKIHSLKDSNKLSFIIEWESENSVQQKLSSEWHIVLSIEKTENETGKIFVFEGRKPDKTFIEGKIEADDIFIAYEMLSKEYSYIITKLYPSSVEDEKERQKIFQELLGTFEEKKINSPKIVSDTSNLTLQKNKALLERIRGIVQKSDLDNKELILSDLKKLELTNNSATIHQSLKNTMKEMVRTQRKRKEFFSEILPIARGLGVFVVPDAYISMLGKIQWFCMFFHPLFTSEGYRKPKKKWPINNQTKTEEDEYESIQRNPHIHTILRKKYQKVSLFQIVTDNKAHQSYIYTLYRTGIFFFASRKTFFALGRFFRWIMFSFLFLLLVIYGLGMTQELFVFNTSLSVFVTIIVLSLVIPSETL